MEGDAPLAAESAGAPEEPRGWRRTPATRSWQAGRVEGWQLGLIAVLVVGIAVILVGAISDRGRDRRRRREMLAPPERHIPHLAPDAPAPRYISQPQAHRPPPGAETAELSAAERERLREAIAASSVTSVDVGYSTPGLVTDPPTGWSVLTDPAVLVTEAELTSIRELLAVLERRGPSGRPLVLAAPGISRELVDTFAVNHIQGLMTVLPLVAGDPADRQRIADATGATPVSRVDLRSGYLAPDALGACRTWVATQDRSYLLC